MKTCLPLLVILLALSSCTTYYYTPAMFQNDVQYMAKPYSKDSVKQGLYASGVFFQHSGGKDQGTNSGGLVNLYYSKTFPGVNLSGGVLGFAGSFDNGDGSSLSTFTSKSFRGVGANASISGYIPFEHVDWRVLGFDAIYTKESGSYADFRQGLAPITTSSQYILIPQTGLFTYGLFTEVVVRPTTDVSLAFKLGANRTGGQVSRDINKHVFQNVGFNAAIGYKKMEFISALKLRPTEFFAVPVGVQFGAAYRF